MSRVFDKNKGLVRHYVALAQAGTGAIIVVPVESSGLEAFSALVTSQTLAEVFDGATNEQTTLGRKVAASPTSSADTTAHEGRAAFVDPEWTGAAGAGVGALVCAYRASGGDPDSAIEPLTIHEWVVAAPTGTLTADFDALGFYAATEP